MMRSMISFQKPRWSILVFTLLTGGVVVLPAVSAPAIAAQATGWSLSRDTVREWLSAADTLTIQNTQTDTLHFDSVRIEILGDKSGGRSVWFYVGLSGGNTFSILANDDRTAQASSTLSVPPLQTVVWGGFNVDVNSPPFAKRVYGTAIGDTLSARLIFMASQERGRDTLTVMGTQQSVSLRSLAPVMRGESVVEGRFDLRGRRIIPASHDTRTLATPTLTPRD